MLLAVYLKLSYVWLLYLILKPAHLRNWFLNDGQIIRVLRSCVWDDCHPSCAPRLCCFQFRQSWENKSCCPCDAKDHRELLIGMESMSQQKEMILAVRSLCWETSAAISTSGILGVSSLGMLLVPVVCQPRYWWQFLWAACWKHSLNWWELVCKESLKMGNTRFQSRGGMFRLRYEVELEIIVSL